MSPSPVKEKSPDITDSYSIIAKNFLVLPGIARDLSAIVSGVIGIVKQKGGEVKEGPDESFIAERDFQAAEKLKKPTQIADESKKKKEKGGIGISISDLLSPKKLKANLMKFAKKMFSPKNMMKILGRIALPALIISTLWVGISSGFEKWKETGSIWEAYKEAVGSIVEFLTFGLIDKETVKNLYQGAADFLMPVIKPIQEFFGKFSDWVGEKFNAVLKLFGIDIKPKEAPKETPQKEQVVTPDILKGKEPVKEIDAQQKAADLLSKPVTLPAEPPPPKPEVQPAASTPAAPTPAPAPTAKDKKDKPSPKAPSPGLTSGKKSMLSALDSEGIKDPTARAQIVAQAAHESGGFKYTEELGKPDYFLKYDGRKDLGNIQPGDGPRFKGRGFLQTTGRINYQQFKDEFGIDVINKPELLASADNAAKSALFWFKKNSKKVQNLTKGDWSNTKAVTKAVNGGDNGLEEREHYFEIFKNDPDVTKVAANQTVPSGASVASNSIEISSGQRQQQKPTIPVIINKPTTNNTNVNTTQLASAPKDTTTGSNMALARAT
jgi:putative chitinase